MEAGKQAHVYIVDQGSTTAECHSGRVESDLDWSLKYVYDKIATVLAANRTTLSVGVLGLRTDESENSLYNDDDGPEDESYQHIAVHKELGPITLSDLGSLQEKLVPSQTEAGDAVSAIVVAIEMVNKFTTLGTGKPAKSGRKIVLVTDGQGYIDNTDPNNLDQIALRCNELGIELIVLGIDFDDLDYGFKEEDKSEQKRENEALLKSLTDQCNKGTIATLIEAIDNLGVPEIKSVRPYKAFGGRLALGDYEKYPETALYIDVLRYTKTKKASAPSASSFVNNKSARKRDVDRDDLAKGYEYGRTAVHISAAEENVTKMDTYEGFSIIGFVPSESFERYLVMGESCMTVAQSVNEKAVVALSSLIHALHELDSYAVARIVLKDMKEPKIILLAPVIEPDFEGLADVPLPFAEDVRIYLPSDELTDAMEDYVDAMDLSTFGKGEDGEPIEYMTMEETYSPTVHRINAAIRNRAIYPDEPIKPPPEVVMKWANPPADLITNAASQLKRLQKVADVKKVEAKKKGKRFNREQITPLSGLDIDALLDTNTTQAISSENSIPEFRQALGRTTSEAEILSTTKQMGAIIRKLVKESVGEASYARALENLRVMREEMVDLDMPEIYNDFVKALKKALLGGELDSNNGGEGKVFWVDVKRGKLGLIDQSTTDGSNVTAEEASEFYSSK
ncbi:putative ATP-dependent DNA helicase II subunit 2 [Glarea lozoyensis 74030]|uniref:ATP-dependent DNA helicase II subunit 2 n=1 Tax=Glarea lozoyensis (strain ATCC 74030 / MF5533) TaxID=1104152 RepID=H0EYL0_GLAL7|nr:putative ATP-dependent DNA helicase II subunit 2 [Glarea lozoyensis 74030]